MDERKPILIAEDDSVLRIIIVKHLSKLGYVGHVAENGAEAVVMATKIRYSVIFMDVMMPKTDGIEAAKQIRQHEKDAGLRRTPIVALTSTVDRQGCLAAGMDDFLSKPITMEQLKDAIDKWAGVNAAHHPAPNEPAQVSPRRPATRRAN